MANNKEPFVHVTKKSNVSGLYAFGIRFLSILLGILVGCILLLISIGANPLEVIGNLFSGVFGTPRRFWTLLRETALLLLVGLALVPAFKMKFWNLGGNGQILVGALASVICMKYLGEAGWDDIYIILVMIPASILAGIIWAVIPAIFKALFNTNESLFTLMLNYVAVGLVALFIKFAVPSGSGALGIVPTGWLIRIGSSDFIGRDYLLTVLVAIVILGLVFAYLRYSKHGYELEVVGESTNTAKYVGINVKKVIIRTMILSGAICGIVGLLIAGSIDHSVSEASAKNLGFTAIMVTWLAHFNPSAMVFTSLLICFLNTGMKQVLSALEISNDSIALVILGFIYFFIIGCEFFIRYDVHFKDCKFVRFMRVILFPFRWFCKLLGRFFGKVWVIIRSCLNYLNEFFKLFIKREGK